MSTRLLLRSPISLLGKKDIPQWVVFVLQRSSRFDRLDSICKVQGGKVAEKEAEGVNGGGGRGGGGRVGDGGRVKREGGGERGGEGEAGVPS